MPTTPKYALPYPALSDPANGPVAFQNLALALETLLSPVAPVAVTAGYAYINSAATKLFPAGVVSVVNVSATFTAFGSVGDTLFVLPTAYRPSETIWCDVVCVSGASETPLRLHANPGGSVTNQIAVANGSVVRGQLIIPRAVV